MNRIKTFIAILSLLSAGLVQAAPAPVAIIEDINAININLAFMDYVNEGQVIKLGKKESITLGYLSSCQREVITGGTITIGKGRSKVSEGHLIREEMECDGGQAKLSGQQAVTSAALAFRGKAKNKPRIIIYGNAPIFRLRTADVTITIKPINHNGKNHTIKVKGYFVDLVNKNISLSPGVYKVVAGENSTIFKVHHNAQPGKAAIISRLIDL